jgi:hypothetical protein
VPDSPGLRQPIHPDPAPLCVRGFGGRRRLRPRGRLLRADRAAFDPTERLPQAQLVDVERVNFSHNRSWAVCGPSQPDGGQQRPERSRCKTAAHGRSAEQQLAGSRTLNAMSFNGEHSRTLARSLAQSPASACPCHRALLPRTEKSLARARATLAHRGKHSCPPCRKTSPYAASRGRLRSRATCCWLPGSAGPSTSSAARSTAPPPHPTRLPDPLAVRLPGPTTTCSSGAWCCCSPSIASTSARPRLASPASPSLA